MPLVPMTPRSMTNVPALRYCAKSIPARDVQLGDRFTDGHLITGIATSFDGRDVFIGTDYAMPIELTDADGMIAELPAGVILLDPSERVDVLRAADAPAPVLGTDPWPNH